ncbi:MAG: DbpA RNA binding domain-containing protein [Methylomonas sp.]|jgi:ATP-dependent RNA helicase DeaD
MQIDDSSAADDKDSLNYCLKQIIAERDLSAERNAVIATVERLNIGLLDLAAALLYLKHTPHPPPAAAALRSGQNRALPKYRFVRYRLDIGHEHNVRQEQIESVLIQESGVEKKRIGRIDIRHNYTLVELPDGMPTDIFQILSEATIADRKLAIKRVKSKRKPSRA